MKQRNKSTSIGFLLTVAMITISFAAIFVKWSNAPATIISMYRMYIAALLLSPVVYMKRKELMELSKRDWMFLALSGIFLALHFALWFSSLKQTTVASSTIILALQPIIALLGGFVFYKEKASISTLITIAVSIVGVAMVGWGDFGLNSSAIIGDILSFFSVLAIVGYLLIGQNIVKKMSHWIYSFCVFFFAAIILTVYNLIQGIAIGGYETREWGIFLLLAIFPTMSHVIFNSLLKYVTTTTISMSVLGEPVGATILAAILLDEPIIGLQLIGGSFALIGVLLFLTKQKKEATRIQAEEISENEIGEIYHNVQE